MEDSLPISSSTYPALTVTVKMSQSEIKTYQVPNFTFHDGTSLPSTHLAYLDINPTASKTALVISCFRGRLHTTLNFASGALKDHRIIVVALFGNGESCSPSNAGTDTFPKLDYRDCVRAQHALLTQHCSVSKLDVVVGFSMGGQCTYHWTLMYPDFVPNAVIMCSSARTSKHNYQFLEGPKAALENAVDYADGGKYKTIDAPSRALKAFGKAYSAWLTSAEWFDQELWKAQGFESLEAWDEEITDKGYAGWYPDDLLAKLGMWQRGDITKVLGSASLEQALGQIKSRVLLMPCQTDQYFRWEANEKEAKSIPNVSLMVIPSVWGHLAGLGAAKEDKEYMDITIRDFLAGQE